jgi:hypothetical protein
MHVFLVSLVLQHFVEGNQRDKSLIIRSVIHNQISITVFKWRNRLDNINFMKQNIL